MYLQFTATRRHACDMRNKRSEFTTTERIYRQVHGKTDKENQLSPEHRKFCILGTFSERHIIFRATLYWAIMNTKPFLKPCTQKVKNYWKHQWNEITNSKHNIYFLTAFNICSLSHLRNS